MVGNETYDWFLIGVFGFAVFSLVSLFFIPAPYGRHDEEGWGPTIPTRLAWVLMEAPASLSYAYFFFRGANSLQAVPLILFAMWQLHYVHRAFIYPFQRRMRKGARTTLFPIVFGSIYCAVNGYLNGSFASTYGTHLSTQWLGDPRFLLGVFLFGIGYLVNKQSDRILAGLRKPGESGYRIPYGGAYRWVSSPNYLGELIAWIGYALASWSLAGVSFVVMTAANLGPRAIVNHRWYHENFDDYPKERKAILPFVL